MFMFVCFLMTTTFALIYVFYPKDPKEFLFVLILEGIASTPSACSFIPDSVGNHKCKVQQKSGKKLELLGRILQHPWGIYITWDDKGLTNQQNFDAKVHHCFLMVFLNNSLYVMPRQ